MAELANLIPQGLYSAVTSVLIFAILIFVHELGHFLVAKWCGVGVVEFAIGFGRKIFRRKYGQTYYSIGIIPLGGYVKMVGEEPVIPDNDDSKEGDMSQQQKPEMPSDVDPEMYADKSCWFSHKPLRSRTAIVLAGPGFNVIFAILFSISSFLIYGKVEPLLTPQIGEVIPDNPAAKAGLTRGDTVISIDGHTIPDWETLAQTVRNSAGKEMVFSIERREGEITTTEELRITGTTDIPELQVLEGAPRIENAPPPYKIGIMPATKRAPVGVGEAVTSGFAQVWGISVLTVRILKAVVMGAIEPSKVVGGPIAVFATAAQSARRGVESIIDFLVLLSVSLAIFNLLPIPVLDGGHLFFFLVEAIKGRPLSLRWQIVANQVGMFLLMVLMIFALRNDVLRYF